MNRRSVIAAGAALTVPTQALADMRPMPRPKADPASDPILPLYRQWHTARADWFRSEDESPEMLEAADREDTAYFRLIEMTPKSLAGIVALSHVFWATEGPVSLPGTQPYKDECGSPANLMISAIWRAASGRDGLPRSPEVAA